MKKGTKCRADACPQPFEIRKLFADRDVYELVANEDVSTEEVRQREAGGEEELRQGYVYTMRLATVTLDGYEAAAAALIGLKYSTGDEFSLMRKGLSDPANEEYVEYIDYVERCKSFARGYFGGGGNE